MAEEEPTARRIAIEAAIFAALVILVGIAFALLRERKDGPRIWTVDPHAGR